MGPDQDAVPEQVYKSLSLSRLRETQGYKFHKGNIKYGSFCKNTPTESADVEENITTWINNALPKAFKRTIFRISLSTRWIYPSGKYLLAASCCTAKAVKCHMTVILIVSIKQISMSTDRWWSCDGTLHHMTITLLGGHDGAAWTAFTKN